MADKTRMTMKQARKQLELQLALDKTVLEQTSHSLVGLDELKNVERARARMSFCRELLSDWFGGQKKK